MLTRNKISLAEAFEKFVTFLISSWSPVQPTDNAQTMQFVFVPIFFKDIHEKPFFIEYLIWKCWYELQNIAYK